MSLVLQALFHRKSTTRKDGKSRKLYWLVWREFWNNFSGMLMLTHIQDDVNTKLLLELSIKKNFYWNSNGNGKALSEIMQNRTYGKLEKNRDKVQSEQELIPRWRLGST